MHAALVAKRARYRAKPPNATPATSSSLLFRIHIVLDNLSAHKTKAVHQFLADHPNVRFLFTPTYSSWLNQVELWFAEIQQDLLARGAFTSVANLARKIRKDIRAYGEDAKPFPLVLLGSAPQNHD